MHKETGGLNKPDQRQESGSAKEVQTTGDPGKCTRGRRGSKTHTSTCVNQEEPGKGKKRLQRNAKRGGHWTPSTQRNAPSACQKGTFSGEKQKSVLEIKGARENKKISKKEEQILIRTNKVNQEQTTGEKEMRVARVRQKRKSECPPRAGGGGGDCAKLNMREKKGSNAYALEGEARPGLMVVKRRNLREQSESEKEGRSFPLVREGCEEFHMRREGSESRSWQAPGAHQRGSFTVQTHGFRRGERKGECSQKN